MLVSAYFDDPYLACSLKLDALLGENECCVVALANDGFVVPYAVHLIILLNYIRIIRT